MTAGCLYLRIWSAAQIVTVAHLHNGPIPPPFTYQVHTSRTDRQYHVPDPAERLSATLCGEPMTVADVWLDCTDGAVPTCPRCATAAAGGILAPVGQETLL